MNHNDTTITTKGDCAANGRAAILRGVRRAVVGKLPSSFVSSCLRGSVSGFHHV